jgi:hypothetical protein
MHVVRKALNRLPRLNKGMKSIYCFLYGPPQALYWEICIDPVRDRLVGPIH